MIQKYKADYLAVAVHTEDFDAETPKALVRWNPRITTRDELPKVSYRKQAEHWSYHDTAREAWGAIAYYWQQRTDAAQQVMLRCFNKAEQAAAKLKETK